MTVRNQPWRGAVILFASMCVAGNPLFVPSVLAAPHAPLNAAHRAQRPVLVPG